MYGRAKSWLFAFAVLIPLSATAPAWGTVENMLAELNAKPAEERQKILVENAKKEGEVMLYTAVGIRDAGNGKNPIELSESDSMAIASGRR
jgi:hypothetical protein